jgi:hypothetical protein
MVISARYDHILRIETLRFLILLQVESTQHTQKVKACDLVCLTRDAIRVLLEKKKKVSLPLLLLLKEKKCLLIISMIMRERESRVLHIKQTFNSLVAGHRIHVVA